MESYKYLVEFSRPFISAILDVYLKPKLELLLKKKQLNDQMYINSFTNKFEDYLVQAFERYSFMNTIVFKNQQKKIDDLYVPLTITSTNELDKETFIVEDYNEDFMQKYQKILITDTAGMGKSTILKWLFLCCIKKEAGIPLFIELRKLSKENTLLDEVFNKLNPLTEESNNDLILALINRGDFIFFLDGYDEIPLSERGVVTEDLQDFIAKASNNIFFLSSRPESALTSFGDFQEFKIRPLEDAEAYELIKKYNNNGDLAEELITKIKQPGTYENISEFLANPMMVSLLYKAYDYKSTIPYKKHIFYRQVYDALFEEHDLTKGSAYIHDKFTGLDIEDFHRILRTLGYLSLRIGKIEFNKDQIISLLKQSKNYNPGILYKESDFLRDLIISVPLFTCEGDYYRWTHKSIQEYFSAQFICLDTKGQQEKILDKIYKSNNIKDFINVLDLCYDMDYKTFRKVIIFNLIEEFLNYCNTTYKSFSDIDSTKVMERQELTFYNVYAFINPKLNLNKDKAWDNCMNKVKQQMNEAELERSFIRGFAMDEQGFRIIEVSHYRNALLQLLYTKGELFVDSLSFEIFDEELLKLDYLTFQKREIIMLNDDHTSQINKEENFEKVTEALRHFRCTIADLQYNLIYSECLKMKKILDKEIQEESAEDYLLNFL